MFRECFHFMGFNFDPGLVHIPVPMTRGSAPEGLKGFVFYLLLLFVETFTVLKISSGEAKV